MSEDFVRFLIAKVLSQGQCVRVDNADQEIEGRTSVEAGTIDFWAAKVNKFQMLSHSNTVEGVWVQVELILNDKDGGNYRAFLNCDYFKLQEEFMGKWMFDGKALDLLEPLAKH